MSRLLHWPPFPKALLWLSSLLRNNDPSFSIAYPRCCGVERTVAIILLIPASSMGIYIPSRGGVWEPGYKNPGMEEKSVWDCDPQKHQRLSEEEEKDIQNNVLKSGLRRTLRNFVSRHSPFCLNEARSNFAGRDFTYPPALQNPELNMQDFKDTEEKTGRGKEIG